MTKPANNPEKMRTEVVGFFSSMKPQAPVMSDDLAEASGAKPCSHRHGKYGQQEGKYIVWYCSMCIKVIGKDYDPPFT